MQKLEKVCKWLFSKKKHSSHVKCIYKIIGRLIPIKILWDSFILIFRAKVNFRFHSLSYIIILSPCCHSHIYIFYGFMVSRQSNPVKSLFRSQNSPILLSGSQESPSFLSSYLGLKVVHPYQVLIVLEPFPTYTYVRSGRLGSAPLTCVI